MIIDRFCLFFVFFFHYLKVWLVVVNFCLLAPAHLLLHQSNFNITRAMPALCTCLYFLHLPLNTNIALFFLAQMYVCLQLCLRFYFVFEILSGYPKIVQLLWVVQFGCYFYVFGFYFLSPVYFGILFVFSYCYRLFLTALFCFKFKCELEKKLFLNLKIYDATMCNIILLVFGFTKFHTMTDYVHTFLMQYFHDHMIGKIYTKS